MADLIDPTTKGNYPVILGVGLLGKPSNEIFTGIRYNHKPAFPQADARLKPSIPGKTSSYDLNFSSAEGTVGFAGTRSTDDGDYVLYFDPERKAFVLDKVDSTFNMNLTRTPANSNPDDLRRRHPHLGSGPSQKAGDQKSASSKDKLKSSTKADNDKSITVQTKEMQKKKPLEKKLGEKKHTDNIFLEKKPPPIEKKSADKKLASEKEKKPLEKEKKPMDKKLSQEKKMLEKKLMEKKSTDRQSEGKPLAKKTVEKSGVERKIHEMKNMEKRLSGGKFDKKPLPKKIELALPVPEPPKPQESRKKRDDDDDEEDDDDDDLLIEYPGAEAPSRPAHHFSPAFPIARRFDDFMDQRESEVEEDDEAMDEDTEAAFKLPSPVKNGSQAQSEPMDVDDEEEEEAEEGEEAGEAGGAADFEYDLEQELENAFDQLDNNDQDNSNSNSGYYYNNNNDDDESEISEED
ncbi:hypothetical protein TGAMA5MH_08693 [Trichoderma gamsii]|uniref:Transcription elongation factor Eaf N-terminal domain-containing protein n=1 Tax=Trichoderma gamsii TaxID=398673 RepID=A0A2K0T177_9HYPO|nr:hypothetical protein TGAMA5MH_08693 [Trichoderma gamsii]